jgi:hypothetical protein
MKKGKQTLYAIIMAVIVSLTLAVLIDKTILKTYSSVVIYEWKLDKSNYGYI